MAYSLEQLMALVPHAPSKIHTWGVLRNDYFNGQGERLNAWDVESVARYFLEYFDGTCDAHGLEAIIGRYLGPDAVKCFQESQKYAFDVYVSDFVIAVSRARPYQPGREPSLNDKGQWVGGYSGGFGS
jgi:hypothetical protein